MIDTKKFSDALRRLAEAAGRAGRINREAMDAVHKELAKVRLPKIWWSAAASTARQKVLSP